MNVSSVKNLNGETFSAVQDAALTDVVQTNSGNWQDITAYQNASAGYLTAVDLSPYQTTAEMVNYYTTADANTMSGMLSGAIDYVSANAGGGSTYSAGNGIDITDDTISVDTTVIPDISAVSAMIDAASANGNLFIAEYGVTTRQEVDAAYNAGKYIVCYESNNNSYLPLTYLYQNVYRFNRAFNVRENDGTPYCTKSNLSLYLDSTWHMELIPANADWNETNTNNISYIANKPDLSNYLTTAIFGSLSGDWEDTADVVQTNSATWGQGGAGDPEVESYVQTNSGAIDETVNAVETNSGTWDRGGFTGEVYGISGVPNNVDVYIDQNTLWISAGSTPTYDYTDNGLISAIDSSALYATSASTANNTKHLLTDGTMGKSISYYDGSNQMFLNPNNTPFGTISGIYGPLQYATGAVITYGSSGQGTTQYFGGFLKGNEWYISNATAGQALRGETHASRGVHLSGATTAGYSFDLGIHCVSGKNDTANGYNWKLERGCVSGKGSVGEWRYGPAEDTLLRSVSSNAGGFYSTSALLYQGSKSDERTTAWNLTESISSYKFIQCDWIDTNNYYISKQINIPSGLDGDMTRAAFFDAVFEHGSDLWCKAQRFSAQDTTVYAQVDEYCVHTDGTISNVGSDVQNNRPVMVQIIGVK